MQERDLKILHAVGGLRFPQVVQVPNGGDGYYLQFEKRAEGKYSLITATKRPRLAADKKDDNFRVFKTLDAAILLAKEIGFNKVEVNFSSVKEEKKVKKVKKVNEEESTEITEAIPFEVAQ